MVNGAGRGMRPSDVSGIRVSATSSASGPSRPARLNAGQLRSDPADSGDAGRRTEFRPRQSRTKNSHFGRSSGEIGAGRLHPFHHSHSILSPSVESSDGSGRDGGRTSGERFQLHRSRVHTDFTFPQDTFIQQAKQVVCGTSNLRSLQIPLYKRTAVGKISQKASATISSLQPSPESKED